MKTFKSKVSVSISLCSYCLGLLLAHNRHSINMCECGYVIRLIWVSGINKYLDISHVDSAGIGKWYSLSFRKIECVLLRCKGNTLYSLWNLSHKAVLLIAPLNMNQIYVSQQAYLGVKYSYLGLVQKFRDQWNVVGFGI